jgi:hypothetical protein
MLTLRINSNHYPMITAPVEWNDGGWRTSILPRVTPEVSEEIDHNHFDRYGSLLVAQVE